MHLHDIAAHSAVSGPAAEARGATGAAMARTDDLNRIVRALQSGVPGVEACALVSGDGLLLASTLPPDLDGPQTSSTAATLRDLGARAAADLSRGDLQELLIRGTGGHALVVNAARGTLLLVLAVEAVRLGLLFLETRRALERLEKVL